MKKPRKVAACRHCTKEKVVAGRGYCAACYSRLQRKGTLERTRAVNFGKLCSVDGCTRPAVAKGMCFPHYDRAQHPLRNIWKLLRSRVGPDQYPKSWESFESFLRDVGERPARKYQLRRVDPTKPYSKRNVRWLAPVADPYYTVEQRSSYSRAWNLRKRFGMSLAEYEQRVDEQGGACAICGKPETSRSSQGDRTRSLLVDHCHELTLRHL